MPDYGVPRDPGQVSQPVLASPGGRGRRGPGVVVAALVVGVLIVAALLLGSGHRGQKNTLGVFASIPISTVTVWIEPPQSYPDNPGEAIYTHDGNPKTEWQSLIYSGGANFSNEGGEGLAIHLSSATTLHQLKVTSPTQGWAASTYVADRNAASLSGWGSPTATRASIAGSTTFELAGRHGSWVLLWMTNTGPSLQISIEELAVS